MAEGRNSKKSHAEILASALAEMQLPFYQSVASRPATSTTTTTATPAPAGLSLQKIPAAVWIGAAAVGALLFMRR